MKENKGSLLKYYLLALAAVLGGSSSIVFVRYATAPSLVLVFYRMAAVSILMIPSALRRRDEIGKMNRRTLLLTLLAGICLGAHFFAYFASVRMTSAAACTVLVDLQVIFVALLSGLLFHIRISAKGWCAILTAFSGAAILAFASGNDGTGTFKGNVIAIFGAVFLAFYFMLSSECRKVLSTQAFTCIVYPVTAFMALAGSAASGEALFGYGPVNYLMALCLAVFPTLLGHSLYSYCLKFLPTPTVSTIMLLDAVFAIVWGFLFFGDGVSAAGAAGCVLAIGGVLWYTLLLH